MPKLATIVAVELGRFEMAVGQEIIANKFSD